MRKSQTIPLRFPALREVRKMCRVESIITNATNSSCRQAEAPRVRTTPTNGRKAC